LSCKPVPENLILFHVNQTNAKRAREEPFAERLQLRKIMIMKTIEWLPTFQRQWK